MQVFDSQNPPKSPISKEYYGTTSDGQAAQEGAEIFCCLLLIHPHKRQAAHHVAAQAQSRHLIGI
ncbi:MAG: hypothetical protein WBN62_20485, partial [Thermoanaerobaculia bacterium]